MQKIVNRIKRVTAGWLLVLLVGYLAAATLFYHTHSIDGVRITHSHPYSQAPDTGNHTHTPAEFSLIAHLSLILMLAAVFGCLAQFLASGKNVCNTSLPHSGAGRKPLCLALRGPPVC